MTNFATLLNNHATHESVETAEAIADRMIEEGAGWVARRGAAKWAVKGAYPAGAEGKEQHRVDVTTSVAMCFMDATHEAVETYRNAEDASLPAITWRVLTRMVRAEVLATCGTDEFSAERLLAGMITETDAPDVDVEAADGLLFDHYGSHATPFHRAMLAELRDELPAECWDLAVAETVHGNGNQAGRDGEAIWQVLGYKDRYPIKRVRATLRDCAENYATRA